MVNIFKNSFLRTVDGEVWTTNTEREYNMRCSLGGSQSIAGTNYYGFIDLSDTVNWPHGSGGRLDFSYVSLFIDKSNAARGSIAIGIITRIDGTSSDITYITLGSFTQNDAPIVNLLANFAPSQLKCEVAEGKLVYVKTNSISLNVAEVNTATPIAFGPGGVTFTPAVGDAIIRIITTGGDVLWGASVFYHSHPTIGA